MSELLALSSLWNQQSLGTHSSSVNPPQHGKSQIYFWLGSSWPGQTENHRQMDELIPISALFLASLQHCQQYSVKECSAEDA